MFVWGRLAFGLDLFHHLPGFVVMTAFTAAAASAFGLVLATAAKTRAQLSGMSTIVILTMSALGGSMFPRFLMSETMQKIGLLLAVSVAQGALGYIQYFNGIPALLVGFHIAGAVCVWTATVALASSLSRSAGDGVEELERGVDEPEVLGRGEVVGAREGDETRVG